MKTVVLAVHHAQQQRVTHADRSNESKEAKECKITGLVKVKTTKIFQKQMTEIFLIKGTVSSMCSEMRHYC